ncbi:MAG: XRE family transcriptional regulator [Niabella sp.]|nr:MAG: XRE family transcriptional regulator [Niabella sp.]
MDLGSSIKKIREAKGMSQKEVALACKIDNSNYSKIENNKTDPAFSSVVKIAKALGVPLYDLFKADEVFTDVNSFDKTLMEKIALIEQLDKKEKTAFYAVLDAFLGKKKMKDALSNVLTNV